MSRFNPIFRMDLPHRAVAVYLYLYERANEKGECWPAMSTIAKELKLSKSTVKRAIADLKKVGVITTKQRYRDNGGKSSLLFFIK